MLCLQFRIFIHPHLLTLDSPNNNSNNIDHHLLGADNTQSPAHLSPLSLSPVLWEILVLQGLKVSISREKGAQALGSWTPNPTLFTWVLRESVRKNVCPGDNQQPSLQRFQEAEPGVNKDLIQMLTTSVTLWVSAQRSFTLQFMGEFEWNSSQAPSSSPKHLRTMRVSPECSACLKSYKGMS